MVELLLSVKMLEAYFNVMGERTIKTVQVLQIIQAVNKCNLRTANNIYNKLREKKVLVNYQVVLRPGIDYKRLLGVANNES